MSILTPEGNPAIHAALIARHLPDWLVSASAADREDYHQRLRRSLASAARASAIHRRLQTPAAFCEPLLRQALLDGFNVDVDVTAAALLRYRMEGRVLQGHVQPLLAAAMANFEAEEAFDSASMILPQALHHWHVKSYDGYTADAERALPITPQAFAETCRNLDLGQRYQAHVQAVFAPGAQAGDVQAWTQDSLRASLSDAFAVQVRRAALMRDITADTAVQLDALLADTSPQPALETCTLRALVTWFHGGTSLRGIVLIRRRDQADDTCVVYMPESPNQPLKQHPSLQAFADDLREQLRDADFCRYFQRFVPQAYQHEFQQRLLDTLSPLPLGEGWRMRVPDATADIGVRADPGDLGVVALLQRHLLDKACGDARAWVVPTDDEDAKSREQRLARYLAVGLGVLNGAALFVPGVGALMAVAGVGQLLGELFIGIDDWRHGQTEDAMAHFFSVSSAVMLVAGAVGVTAAVQASAFVDEMLPVIDHEGRTQLWSTPLSSFRTSRILPDDAVANALGQFSLGDQTCVRIEGEVYPVQFDSARQQWYLQHPDTARDTRVLLAHNGQGAWRGAHEQPARWSALHALRRLGPLTDGLDDDTLMRLRQTCGLSDDGLQALHLRSRPLPALLRLSVADVRAQAQVMELPVQQRGAAFAQLRDVQPVLTSDHPAFAIRRDFSGLPVILAEEIAAGANEAEQALLLSGRVPMRLAEHARAALRQVQLTRACLGLLLADSAWPQTARLRAALLAMPGQASDDAALFARAVSAPAQTARAIGQRPTQVWLRGPERQGDGRLGYALSGRRPRGARTARERLVALYPRLNDDQLQAIEQGLGQGAAQETALRALEQQYRTLYASLMDWADEAPAPGALPARHAVARNARNRVMERLLGAWRRYPDYLGVGFDDVEGIHVDLAGYAVGSLPTLTADFSHVLALSLDECDLAQDPSPFLSRFTGLRTLELQNNHLQSIPSAVAQMPRLGELFLDNNELRPADTVFQHLAGLAELELLSLHSNPLELSPALVRQLREVPSLTELNLGGTTLAITTETVRELAALPQLVDLWLRNTGLVWSAERGQLLGAMRNLRWLDVSRNPLGAELDVSPLTQLRSADFSDCNLQQWPAGLTSLMAAQPRHLFSVALDDNPISEVPALQGLGMFDNPPYEVPPLRISRAGLSDASVARLQAVGIEPLGPRNAVGPDWLIDSSAAVRARVTELRAMPEAGHFLDALDRSEETADYRASRPAGRLRLQTLISALGDAGEQGEDRAALRQQLFDIGEEVMTTCGDGVQLFLRRSETLVLAFEAAHQALDADAGLARLAELGRQMHRESLLDGFVAELYQARVNRRAVLFPQAAARDADDAELAAVTAELERDAPALSALDDADNSELAPQPDEAELRLRLRIDLHTRLALPPQPGTMRYFQALSTTVTQRVEAAVRAADTVAHQLDWLIEQPWWRQYVQRRWPERFAALREHWYTGHAYLLALDDPDAALESVPADVMASLQDFLPAHTWQVEGQPQRVTLSPADAEAARQVLNTAERLARAALVRALSATVLAP